MSDRSIHSAAALLVPLSMVILLLLSGIPYNPELPKETEISHTGGMILDAVMVKDIYSGNISSSPTLLTAIGNTLYFAATTASTGNELWKSDGTTSGTMMVKDINSGSSSGSLGVLTAVGNTLYFTANDGFSGRELWKSDGTTSGTMMVKDIHSGASGSSPNHFAVMGSTLYFQANDGINGHELWKSDGTTSGTIMVKDINNGSVDSSPTELTVVGSTLFFSAKDSVGRELWKSDGTASGTVMVKNIWTGSAGPGDGDPKEMTSIGNTLYFQAASWDIDGDGYFDGVELWKSDGTTSGTVRVKDINNNTNGSSTPSDLVVIDYGALEILFFRASDGTNGGELWKSDGTTAGTVMVKDIYSGSSSGSADHLTAVGNTLYFKASDGTNGAELWKSDGTTAGTVMVKDINSGGASIPQHLTAVGNTLFFQAIDGTNGNELWKSDGTTAGTVMVKDINSGGASYPNQLTAVGNTLFFQATEGTNGNELWKTFEAPEDAATATAEAGIHHSGSQVAVITNLTGVTPGWDYTVDWSLYYSSNGTEIFSFNQPYSYFINSTTFDTGWSYFNADDLVVGVDICLEVSVYNGTTASSTNALGSDSKCMQLPDWINFMKNSGNGVGGSVGNSIAFDSNDNAHISYYDDSSSSHWLKYTGYIGTDGSGNPTSWTNMIVDSSVDEVGLYSSIGVDSNDKVHISYYDATNQCLKYAHRSIAAGGEWSASTIDCSNDVGMFNSLVIDSSDAVHIAYFDATDSELKYAYNDGTGWSTNTIATGNVGHWISIAVDPWDNVHIAYRHLGDLSLMYVTIGAAGNWNSQVVDNTTADVGKHTSIAVDGAGSVYISYYDHTNQDLKVATRGTTQSAWYITTLDSADDVGKFSSISVDSSDYVHVSYYDSTNQNLKYLTGSNTNPAVISTIDSEGDVGKYTSLALDSDGKPHIAYYESTPNVEGLKFACLGCTVTNATSGPTLSMNAWYNSADQIYISPFTLSGISTTENYNVDMILTYESNGTIIDNQWENFSCGCSTYAPQTGLNWNLGSSYNGNEILDNTAYVLWANVYNNLGTIITQSNTLLVFIPPGSGDSGVTWSNMTVDSTGAVGEYSSIAVDSTGTLHISYFDSTNYDLKYVTGNGSSWTVSTVDSTGNVGYYTSIAVDSNDDIHISYFSGTNYDLKYATYDGSSWTTSTVDNTGNVGQFTSIAVDSNDDIHISYFDDTNYDLKYVTGNGLSWTTSTVDSTGNVGEYTSIAVDSNDNIHISYYDHTDDDLKYAAYDGSSWAVSTVDSTGVVGQYTSIAVDSNDDLHISYNDADNDDLKYATYDGSSWSTSTVDITGNVGKYTSIAVDSNDDLHISYYDATNLYLKYATAVTSGSGGGEPSVSVNLGYSSQINKLQVVYVLSNLDASNTYILERALFFQLNSTSIVGDSITVDCNCNSDTGSVSWEEGAIYAPHIITDDTDYCVEVILKNSAGTVLDQIVSCANFPQTDDGLSWLISTIPDATGGYGEFVDMALDSQETPHFCYYDSGNSDLKYAMFDGSSWVVTHVDGDANAQTTGAIDGDIGKYCSIAFDSNNMPHISYYDATNGNLRFAAFDGNGWTSEIVDDFGDVGTDTSLAISSNGTPHISYYGEGSNDTIVLYYTYKINNSWGLQALDDVGDLQHSPTGAQTSIVLTNDFASISYYDAVDGDLEFFWEDDDSWYWKTIDSDGLVGSFSSHIVDGDGRPHISYYDETNGALKYAAYDGLADWSNTTLDDEGDAGLYTSLAFNDDGFVSISYFDSSNGSLKYIVLEPNQWNEYTIDTVGRIGEYSSLAIDSTGEIYVAYYDNTAAVLKLACNTCNFTDSGGSSGGSDGDNDGVEDSMDDCPDGDSGWTSDPLTTDYDQDGCRDATEDDDDDNDGIDDGDDSCYQGMTGWWSWDEDPVVDFDHDGCLDTGEDDDDDNDGRGDTSDTCLETRLGAVVDTEGCESSFPDDDGDGVSNSYDDCPNTTAGVGVDDFDGCPEGDDGSGVTWSNLIIDSAGDVGQYSSIAIDSNDNLHISYFDMNNGALKYATYDGSSWTTTTVDMGDVGLYSSIAIDSNNNIHISYYDSTNSALKYATYDGSSWTISTVDNLGTLGTHTSIAVDSSDNLHISYRNDTGVALKYATYDGSLWTTSTVDSTGNVGKYSSIAVDSNDNLHISYFDDTNDDLKYATYDGSTWTNSTVDSAGDVGYDTSIAVDSNDNLYISYLDLANVDLKSATYDGSSWTVSTVDSVGDGLVHSSIAVDSNDDIHISYHAGVTNWILKYATYDGSSWTTSTIDNNIGNVGQYSSIAVDSNDDIHISYFDSVNDVLKYATTSASGGSSGGSGDGNGTGVDSDGDGVSDDDDDCPNNAANPPTDGDYDGDGCPDSMDNDKDDDDVFDINDNCIYSPLGWSTLDEDPIVDWDHDGCLDDSEDLDVDGDGVSNGVDECAYTLIGGTVDDVGCLSSEDEVVDDIESDEDPEDEWYSNIPVIGSQIDPLVEMVQTKYGKAISASIFVLTALGYAYRVVTVRSEMKMKKRMNKFEKRIDNANSEKGLRKIERDVEIDEEKNNLPLGGYGDLMSMIENREEDLGIGEGSKSEQMMSMASGMQAEMADSMQAMRETQEDIASMADSMRDAHPQQRGGPQGMAASPRPMQTSSGLNRPSYHPKDMDEDGFVSDEDLAKFNSLSKAEQIARQSRASDDKGLTGEIVRFSKLPRSSKARCYCGSNKQFGKCHLGKEKCPCNSGKKFLKCCAKKRNFR